MRARLKEAAVRRQARGNGGQAKQGKRGVVSVGAACYHAADGGYATGGDFG